VTSVTTTSTALGENVHTGPAAAAGAAVVVPIATRLNAHESAAIAVAKTVLSPRIRIIVLNPLCRFDR
jgi:hypothetical protein